MKARSVLRLARCGALLLTAVALGLTACGTDSPEATSSAPASTGNEEGTALYQTNCASCHGTDLRGTDKGPSHLSKFYEPNHHGDDAFRSAILNGSPQHHWNFGDMKPVPNLDDEEINAVITYIRAVQQQEGFEQ